jgi:hypothetical protein
MFKYNDLKCSKIEVIYVPPKMQKRCEDILPSKPLYYMGMWSTLCSGHSACKGKSPQYPLHRLQISLHEEAQKKTLLLSGIKLNSTHTQ